MVTETPVISEWGLGEGGGGGGGDAMNINHERGRGWQSLFEYFCDLHCI